MTDSNPVLAAAIDAVMLTLSKRFDLVFSRPDAAEIVQGFIGGGVAFGVHGDRIEILMLVPETPDTVPAEWADDGKAGPE